MGNQGNPEIRLSLNKRQFYYGISILLYKLSLDFLYVYAVNPIYSYQGFILDTRLYKYIISNVLVLIMINPILRLYNKGKSSSLIILILNLIYFIPGCTLYAMAGIDDMYFVFFALYWILIMLWQKCLPRITINFKKGRFRRIFFYALIILVLGSSVAITGIYNGFNINLSLSNVYDLRYAQREMNLPWIVGYIEPLSMVVIPVSLVYFLIKKKPIFSTMLVFVQLLLFSFGGSKFSFFAVCISVLAYLFYNINKDYLATWGLIVLNITSIIEAYFNENVSMIAAYVQRRVFFTPNLLSFQYYDYFNNNELLFLRASILRRLGFNNPYNLPIPRLIGDIYYGNIENNANNGMIGDAYANFGWMGLVIYPLIIGLSLKLLDACSKDIDPRVLLSVCVLYAVIFTNASFFQMMLTNGFLFMCLFLYYYPRSETKKENMINA